MDHKRVQVAVGHPHKSHVLAEKAGEPRGPGENAGSQLEFAPPPGQQSFSLSETETTSPSAAIHYIPFPKVDKLTWPPNGSSINQIKTIIAKMNVSEHTIWVTIKPVKPKLCGTGRKHDFTGHCWSLHVPLVNRVFHPGKEISTQLAPPEAKPF